MDNREIKKLLAGVGIAGLLSGAGVILTSGPAAAGGSGCGGSKGGGGMMNMDHSGGMPSQMQGAADMGKDAAKMENNAPEMNAGAVQNAATETVKEKVQNKVEEKVQEAMPDK